MNTYVVQKIIDAIKSVDEAVNKINTQHQTLSAIGTKSVVATEC